VSFIETFPSATTLQVRFAWHGISTHARFVQISIDRVSPTAISVKTDNFCKRLQLLATS
jgi:hypothetical protein